MIESYEHSMEEKNKQLKVCSMVCIALIPGTNVGTNFEQLG